MWGADGLYLVKTAVTGDHLWLLQKRIEKIEKYV